MTQPQPGGASEIDSRDVVELILADHREFERLFRSLRNRDTNRQARLRELADLLVAHAEAEERDVLNAARENVDIGTRQRLGDAFLQARNDLIAQSPGEPEKVRELIAAAGARDSSSKG